MDEEEKLLRQLCETAAMGRMTTGYLRKVLPPGAFAKEVEAEFEAYHSVCQRALALLNARQIMPRRVPFCARCMAHMMMEKTFWQPHTRSRLAQMLLQGNIKGLTKTKRFLRETREEISEASYELAKELLDLQKKHAKQLLKYL